MDKLLAITNLRICAKAVNRFLQFYKEAYTYCVIKLGRVGVRVSCPLAIKLASYWRGLLKVEEARRVGVISWIPASKKVRTAFLSRL